MGWISIIRDHHHHQPIILRTTGAQASLWILIRRTNHNLTHGNSADWWMLTTTNTNETNGLMLLSKHKMNGMGYLK
jgi:hypothetical protein